MKYQKILVGLDRSEQNSTVFQRALHLAKLDNAQLMIFYCQPFEEGVDYLSAVYSEEFTVHTRDLQEKMKHERERDQDFINNFAEAARNAGVPTEAEIRRGDAGRWIRQLAKSWEADLIVVGHRGHRGLAELFLGSVSNYILHHAPCSVLVVQ
ncbi:universal stress protein [Spirulina sp. CS-785/01]|uniref:universal stress protein n=1 Tax=Spirulina sp. CS-785/01 TaxID=3021716 RepID=UPI00232C3F48|nr:universal stress protein [Spirulina sp. CS-785/01]MDB9314664.1 universal stress protein [Spirulina sp. CS-785/01]